MNFGGKTECLLVNNLRLTQQQKRNGIQFKITCVDEIWMNMFRGILLEEIPCLAFHTIRFEINDTVLKHQQIMLKLSLLPLVSDAVQDLAWSYKCSCTEKPCENCSVAFYLDVENTTNDYKHVTSDDLVAVPRKQALSKDCRPLYTGKDSSEIVCLAPGQRLKLTAYAQVGIGRFDGKFVCVPTMIFQGIPQLNQPLDAFLQLNREQQTQIAQSCPRGALTMSENNHIDIEDVLKCTLCSECVLKHNSLVPEQQHLKNIQMHDTDFFVTIESDGRLTIEQILKQACSILITHFK